MYISPFWMGLILGFVLGVIAVIVLALCSAGKSKEDEDFNKKGRL